MLNLPDVPVGIGTTATTKHQEVKAYEFYHTEHLISINTDELKNGAELLKTVLKTNAASKRKAKLLLLSSLTDIAYLSVEYPEILTKDTIECVIMQGKYIIDEYGERDPDLLQTTNNAYDVQATKLWHQYMVSLFRNPRVVVASSLCLKFPPRGCFPDRVSRQSTES